MLFRDGNDRFIGRYCGNTAPGPVESPRGATGIRIHLHTDAENVSSGFKGRYVFEVAKSVTGEHPFHEYSVLSHLNLGNPIVILDHKNYHSHLKLL